MITKRQFNTFEDLFNYYNSELFDGELPEVMINMSRKKNSLGYFAPDRWKSATNEEKIHEISLNPDHLDGPVDDWHSTLVHEMAHLWRQIQGGKITNGYHDKVWGNKMEAIGLMPSNTGAPGGKKTGQKMDHYILPGHQFIKAFEKIQGEDFSELVLPFLPTVPSVKVTKEGKPSKQGQKIKYTCSCGNNVWGKSDMRLSCDDCGERYEMNQD